MKDKTGRTLSVGCLVDIIANGMLTAHVVEIREGGIIGPQGPMPPVLILQVGIPIKLEPGENAPVYLVRDVEKKFAGPQPVKGVM